MADNKIDIEQLKKHEEFYVRLQTQLDQHHDFPEDYTFKFIIENNQSKLTEIYKVFDDVKYTFSTNESKNGKYVSCTIVAFVLSADQVIAFYKAVSKIDGVIML
ncbi:DUF493 domain-containing protein [Elizabethkingia sp. JS20170427COW]|uniref:DUF493 domain-containing protein n=1 Tax=Elizabethkingia sp. JS20170427COW TaxID=2583851 RepID=UPI001110BEDE|nr:DUF493 domain-containing protein [Elizabethkingia sp. JS20170427COW]QCX54152.1 DUF493 domain-containing protein [Elizabethkingia sp. JS20170427COW]